MTTLAHADMNNTSQQNGVHHNLNGRMTNGEHHQHLVMSEEDIEERLKMRPADVDADMREMSRRKRVDAILGSRTFRAELDRLIDSGTLEGGHMMMMNGVQQPQQYITDVLGSLSLGSALNNGLHCVQPIADLRGVEACQLSKQEKLQRCKLASLLRLFQLHGWVQDTGCAGTHVTLRITQDQEHFLVNPVTMSYSELSAATIVKVDMQGCLVQPHSGDSAQPPAAEDVKQLASSHQLRRDTFHQLHAAVHAARPDLRCVAHVQCASVVAVSSLRCGLLPLTEHACRLGAVSHHTASHTEDERELTKQLGVHNKVMLLANRGALCCGDSVEEVYFLVSNLITACDIQVRMMPLGVDNLVMLDDQQRRVIYEECRQHHHQQQQQSSSTPASADTHHHHHTGWRLGEVQFEALMRVLDNAGYRTGHLYRQPARHDVATHQSDVEYPPAASSYTYDTDDVFKYSPMRKMFAGLRSNDRNRWLNSPNAYQKVEILETGTVDPKKITKWVSDDSPSHSGTTIKVDSLQFVPKNTNPKEFKQLQQQIKENRRAGGISAGPQSHILEGVSWDEARDQYNNTAAVDSTDSRTADQVVLVGAASKGIIQRNYQHHATVYKTPYAKNPFDQVTDEDLDEYKRTVEMKSRGESVDTERMGVVPEHAERVQLDGGGGDVGSDTDMEPVTSLAARGAGDVSRMSGGATAADDTDAGQMSAVSHTDQEDMSTSEASKKDKKKKKGLRTPSFLKKRKDKKRDKKEAALDSSKN